MPIADTLRVARSCHLGDVDVEVDFDEYIPLRFRTYRDALGVGYFRLGDYSTTLVEITVEPRTQVVRGLTVVSIDRMSPWPPFEVLETLEGLPVLETSFEGGEVHSLPHDFMVAARPGEVVVLWGGLERCKGYRVGGVCFLIADGTLAGAWFSNLTAPQIELFASRAGT